MSRVGGALLVSAVSALLVLPPLGQRTLATSDEARFALLARDMLERRVFFSAQVMGRPYRNKPPLYPWAIAGLSLARGRVTAGTAQAPVAAAAIGTVLFAFLLGDRLFNRRAGLWAGLILATSYGFFALSQESLPDLIVACFATMAGYAFWRSAEAPAGRGALLAFYVALALGLFAKGPVGLLPLIPVALWLWSEHGGGGIVPRLWSPIGASLFLLVTLVWLVPFLTLGAGSFGRSVVWQDWLAWYAGVPPLRNLENFATDLLIGLLPWTLMVPLAVVAALRARSTPAVRFTLLWVAVPLLAILLVENQRTRYLAPVYPGAALLLAWWADAAGAEKTTGGRILAWLSLAAAGGALTVLAVPTWLGPEQRPFVEGLAWRALPIAVGVALLGGVLWWGLWRSRPALLIYGGTAAMAWILAWGIWLYTPRFNALWDFPRVAAAIERTAGGREVGACSVRWLAIDFYLGRPLRRLETPPECIGYLDGDDRPLAIVRKRDWPVIEAQLSSPVRVRARLTVGGQELLLVQRRDSAR